MLAPLAGPAGGTGFVVVAALGSACKAICGMTAGATRASITAHFALRDNLADVSAKEGAQVRVPAQSVILPHPSPAESPS